MMKSLPSICGLAAISLVFVACADTELPTSTDDLGLQAAVVSSGYWSTHAAAAYGSDPGVFEAYVYLYEDLKVDTEEEPGPIKYAGLWVGLTDYNNNSNSCSDELELSTGDYSWSMRNATVNVSTACGAVEVTISATGPIEKDNWDYWQSYPEPNIETCSPPEGTTSHHIVGREFVAPATGSGTIGGYAVTLDSDGYIKQRVEQHTTCR